MNILVVLDTNSQSTFVVKEVARLADNTWANVTLLGVESETATDVQPDSAPRSTDAPNPLLQSLRGHRELFLSNFKAEKSPYEETRFAYQWVKVQNNLWEDLKVCRGAHKRLATRIRSGNPARAVLTEAKQFPCDLIVIGGARNDHGGDMNRLSKKVTHEADTSVLVVTKTKKPRRIVACLDHDCVSQHSLEMINQMVTLFQADLEIVGIATSNGLSGEIDRKMSQILKYYAANGIKVLVRSVSRSYLESFVAQASRENLVALWMGKQSLLHRLFSPKGMDRLLDTSNYSVLMLR